LGNSSANQHKYFSTNLFFRICIVAIYDLWNFLFLHFTHKHLIPPPLIFPVFKYEKLIKTLNHFTIIFHIQLLRWISIHLKTIIHYLKNLYRILMTTFINNIQSIQDSTLVNWKWIHNLITNYIFYTKNLMIHQNIN